MSPRLRRSNRVPAPHIDDFVLITGFSGAGKSQAMAAFEDAGYFCVDNLPPEMIGSLADLFAHPGSKVERAAVVCDVRGGEFFEGLIAVLDEVETGEPLARDDTRSFTFRARVRGVELNAMVLAEFNDDAQIADLTLFGRPLPATAALFAALPPRVSTRRRGPAMGALVAVVTRPIAFVLRTVDRLVPRFL